MTLWLRRLGYLSLFVVASFLCWAFATRFRRKDGNKEEPLRASFFQKAEAIRFACQEEIQAIDKRLDQARAEIESTRNIENEKARLQALADLANKRRGRNP